MRRTGQANQKKSQKMVYYIQIKSISLDIQRYKTISFRKTTNQGDKMIKFDKPGDSGIIYVDTDNKDHFKKMVEWLKKNI